MTSMVLQNIIVINLTQQKWASEELPEFKQSMWSLYNDCTALAMRILELMGVGMQLEVRYSEMQMIF